MKYVIVGGVAGGATAAARLRRVDETADILLLEKGPHISYANCGLPYYIGGVIAERDKLLVQTPEAFGKRFRIDVRVKNEVLAINAKAKTLTIRNADGKEYEEAYDKLLLSPGANPVKPPLEGIESEGIFTLRNVEDTDRIKAYVTGKQVKRAVVVGAGFIGLEMAENLHHAGIAVSVVEMGNQVMAPIDFSMAAHIHRHLIQKGVSLYLEEGVTHFQRTEQGIIVYLKSGKTIAADMVLLSIGVRPATALAQQAGLKLGETGGIWVDEHLETSEKDIYAVGDAIEYPHPLTGKPWLNYLANPANRQGRIVADNMALGNTVSYEGAIGTSIAKVFDMTVASTGLAAKRLKQWGMEYQSSVTHSSSHAGYYPNALPITLKLTFHPRTGKLYGAQCVGYEGVDKRIDQIAGLIKRGGTVYDLMETEHAYAPSFSSAKDPIAIAGYVASNIVGGAMPAISWRELLEKKEQVVLVDTRTAEEFSFGTIPGALNIPLDEMRERLAEIPADKPVVLFCAVGLRGYLAQRILMGRGYRDVRNLMGGYKTFSTAVAPLPAPTALSSATVSSSFDVVSAEASSVSDTEKKVLKVNACGLQCPGPIIQVKKAIDSIEIGERVEIVATDAGFARDASAWCETTGNKLIENREEKGRYTVVIEKGDSACACSSGGYAGGGRGKTLILFSDDLDKALATFVLANGAAATGQKVSIFFTFWGLNVLKKVQKPRVQKDFFGKMFGMMLPSSSLKLKLSQMNMFGMGSRMMRFLMKRKGVDSLESLRRQALMQGVEFIACQMSMDMMGIQREELLDEVTVGGVATYMERADKANVNLFI
ncbi:pyridine nucleotide-disulfide oxidoreductase [Bacteroides heparinolyticus]|uniref:Pyridine nucleotide-disulfide oxidoreductase n=3 Tax=Prevotella heparinolytica TaxID=28113 RepID=A0A3P2ADL5_9BACE|nr:FAD-dependent oxidoreductase [Bacteroides heparinolyticus]RRD92260.1 pyridine nucleotide-disulfide oxidoreductase [Bacteroides heparinolyticus]